MQINLPVMDKSFIATTCRLVSLACSQLFSTQVWLKFPDGCYDAKWKYWTCLYTSCKMYLRNLGLILEISNELNDIKCLDRWISAPVKALWFPKECWVRNSSGYPVLFRPQQRIAQNFVKLGAHLVYEDDGSMDDLKSYALYLLNLIYKTPETYEDRIVRGYEDVLQIPLQPLGDNLDMNTYKTFMNDEQKYALYTAAIQQTLDDRVSSGKEPNSDLITVIVLGAGSFMPLAECILQAADKLSIMKRVNLIALEKNPHAITHLEHIKLTKASYLEEKYKENGPFKGRGVEIIFGDMRECDSLPKADIVVSELLGSFGDNELSPECLKGISKILKTEKEGPIFKSGISIPADSTAYVSPVHSTTLERKVNELVSMKNNEKYYETPFVVYMKKVWRQHEPLKVWQFHHPHPQNERMSRESTTEFLFKESTTIHGMAGYFTSNLVKDVMLSTNPSNHSFAMLSWFPLYFPFKETARLSCNQTLVFTVWRKMKNSKVWYEWCYQVWNENSVLPVYMSEVHNMDGNCYSIDLNID